MGADRQSFFNPRSTPRVELCQSHINAYCSPCRRNINIALNRNTKLTVVLVTHDEQVALAVLEYTPFSQRINESISVSNVVKTTLYICINDPFFRLIRTRNQVYVSYRIMGASAWSKAVAYTFKLCFSCW